jgi:signal transduction histidine kinase
MNQVSTDDTTRHVGKRTSPYGVLSRRLLVLILCCSTLFTFIATAIQLYLEYQTDVQKIDQNVSFIETSYVPAFARSLYELNDEQLSLQLDGALQLDNIVFLKLLENIADEARERSVGTINFTNLAYNEFDLSVEISGKPFKVGSLIVASTTDNITRQILTRGAQILAINAAKTFFVAFLVLLIIQSVVTRHIADMAQWAESISLERLSEQPLELKRNKMVDDELQHVANAMNQMRERITTDVTARTTLEAETRKLTQELHHSEKLQAIGELAGGIAHDFNNQLHIILANADLLKEQFPDSPEATNFANNIIKSCENSSDLIANLMTFSRKEVPDGTFVGINNIMVEVSNLLKLGTRGTTSINLDIRAERDKVNGDVVALQNAFLNMGLNARDALDNGGEIHFETDNVWLERGAFATGPDKAGWFVRSSVIDTGSGIAPANLSRIFEPFFT